MAARVCVCVCVVYFVVRGSEWCTDVPEVLHSMHESVMNVQAKLVSTCCSTACMQIFWMSGRFKRRRNWQKEFVPVSWWHPGQGQVTPGSTQMNLTSRIGKFAKEPLRKGIFIFFAPLLQGLKFRTVEAGPLHQKFEEVRTASEICPFFSTMQWLISIFPISIFKRLLDQ